MEPYIADYGQKSIEPNSKLLIAWGQIKKVGREFFLVQNYPNPFNPETWIPYQLATDSEVTITIYDSTGQVVRILDLGHREVGYYRTYWDGRDDVGQSLASGIYFYVLKTDDGFSDTKKMMLLR